MISTIALVIHALVQGHDKEWLDAEMHKLINRVWISAPETPDAVSARLQQLILTGRRFKVQEAEDFVDAMSPAATTNPSLAAELVALDLIVARLGGMVAAYRIRRRIMEELRTWATPPLERLP